MEKWSIKSRLAVLTLLMATAMVGLGIGNAAITRKLSSSLKTVVDDSMPSIRLLTLIDMVHDGVRSTVLEALLSEATHDESRAKSARENFKKFEVDALGHFESLGKKHNSPEFNAKVEIAFAKFRLYLQSANLVIDAAAQDKPNVKALTDSFEAQFTELEELLENVGEYFESESGKNNEAIMLFASRALGMAMFALLAALIFGALLARYINGSVTSTLHRITSQLGAGSESLSSAVAQLSAASGSLSTSATSQASALQQTAASVQQISAMVRKSAESAATSQAAATNSKEKAGQGQQVVSEMVVAIEEINKNNERIGTEIDESNKRITDIVNVIRAIGEKTKVINDIVFQTKLLSFNASVEAARAGEHGKGFAVVAEEVGNLAAVSGNASKEISDLLDGSVRKVNAIVEESKSKIGMLTAKAKATVEHGVKVAGQCGGVLNEIVHDAASVSGMIGNIAAASREQASGIEEISKALQLLNQSTQTTVTAASACSQTSESLSSQSQLLRESSDKLQNVIDGKIKVSRFTWKEDYSLKVPQMDGEHKILIQKINSLAVALEQSNGKASKPVTAAYADLAQYTRTHFSHEEEFMASFSYSDLAKHKEIHRTLLAKVDKFEAELKQGRLEAAPLMNFLNDWLLKHILAVDMRYSEEFRRGDGIHRKRAA